jgi:hypothetical protein
MPIKHNRHTIHRLNSVGMVRSYNLIMSIVFRLDQPSYDHDIFTPYGQSRTNNSDPSYAQQTSPPPPIQEIASTSKLSANAATFPHTVPLVTANSTTNADYVTSLQYTIPSQYVSIDNRVSNYC